MDFLFISNTSLIMFYAYNFYTCARLNWKTYRDFNIIIIFFVWNNYVKKKKNIINISIIFLKLKNLLTETFDVDGMFFDSDLLNYS